MRKPLMSEMQRTQPSETSFGCKASPQMITQESLLSGTINNEKCKAFAVFLLGRVFSKEV
jgi:hypothetical protein